MLSTPWGAQSEWAQQPLLVALHREAWGGEKFFEMLDRISQDPARHIDLMELQYLCIAFGFTGKYQVLERGHARLAEVQQDLYRKIRAIAARLQADLSLRWRGVEDRRNRLMRYVPWWVVGAAALAILGGDVRDLLRASRQCGGAGARAAGEGRHRGVFRAAFLRPPAAGPTLKQLLATDEAGHAVGRRRAGRSQRDHAAGARPVRVRQRDAEPGLRRHAGTVSAALNQVPGQVLVEGHTDDQPLRSFRYRDNFELSRERAVSVAQMLQGTHRQPGQAQVDRPRLVAAAVPARVDVREPRAQPARRDRPRTRIAGPEYVCSCCDATLPIVLGLLLLALFIWFAGPYFAFADYQSARDPRRARLIAIAVVVGLWAASLLLKRLRANRASDRLVAAVVKQAQPRNRGRAPTSCSCASGSRRRSRR